MQVDLHGVRADLEDRGDVGHREVVEVVEGDRLRLSPWQPPDGSPELGVGVGQRRRGALSCP